MARTMFWEWALDLFYISFGNIQVCPNCFLRPSTDCGYGVRDYVGEFNCTHPNANDLDCDGCTHILCNDCKEGGKNGFNYN